MVACLHEMLTQVLSDGVVIQLNPYSHIGHVTLALAFGLPPGTSRQLSLSQVKPAYRRGY
jgi:hypothetical protein